MAVGQLLDYEFQGRAKFGELNKDILVPEKLDRNVKEWLQHLSISVIHRQGSRSSITPTGSSPEPSKHPEDDAGLGAFCHERSGRRNTKLRQAATRGWAVDAPSSNQTRIRRRGRRLSVNPIWLAWSLTAISLGLSL